MITKENLNIKELSENDYFKIYVVRGDADNGRG